MAQTEQHTAAPAVSAEGTHAADTTQALNNEVATSIVNEAQPVKKTKQGVIVWPLADIPNSEAIDILRQSKSGVYPCLNRRIYRALKRLFDIVLSGIAIVVLAVPSMLLACVIVIKSPGSSPFYKQTRVGRLNKDGSYHFFSMIKFRSMVPNADELLSELKDQNEADGPLFKIKDDPRIIPGIGHFIRKHSIDELPQLLNVFVGQMSLVGPRPALPNEVVLYDQKAKQRLTVKAGCGGPWQAGPRSASTFEQMIDLDLDYVEKCSLVYDAKLIVLTIKAMFSGDGAY